jgi:hypothetical protein
MLHGRGIRIYDSGSIIIGYYENGKLSTGNYIQIYSSGNFGVSEWYKKDGREWDRGTRYMTDGKEGKYGY